jgi:hypothetical protein
MAPFPARRSRPRRLQASRGAAAAILLVVCQPAGTAAAQVVDRVLAVVDRQVITLSDVEVVTTLGLVPAADRSEVLRRLVDRTLVLAEVSRYAPPAPTDADVDEQLARVRARAAGVDVPRALRRAGLDDEWLRRWARQTLLVERHLEQRFGVTAIPTDEQVEQYYRGRRAEFTAPDGSALGPEAALALARERLTAERRARLVSEWMDDLRRRADIDLREAGR